ncbi:MAG: t4-like baseplate wedge [Deltaproteobacteria bacterium]|nr:t4-like baseplate wedge [Deltaproteobacteria bacterium]
MPILPPSVDYTDKSFDSLRARLISLIKSVFPDWSDFEVAAFGSLLIDMYAFVGDVVTYYLDKQARESRLSTATQRKNVIALARMLGYRLHGAQAATAEEVFSLARRPIADVVISAGSIIRTQEITEPIKFQLLDDVVISAGMDPPTATGIVEHSQTHAQLFDSRGLANLDVALGHTPYLDGSAVVSATNGSYTEQDSLLSSGPNDRHYIVLVDQNDRATVRFGNGANGAPPTGTISVTYKTGGGASGNVEPSSLVVAEGVFQDIHGHPVQVSATNPEPASGGTDRQSVASAKLLAPESLRALTRTVAREDFEIHAKQVPGVARALMLTSNEDASISENSGVLYVVPQGGGAPTPALKNNVLHMVTETYPCTLTFQASVQDPVYKTVDIEARVYLRQGYDPIVVRERIKSRLQEMFSISNPDGTPNPFIDFGFNIKDSGGNPVGEITWSDVFNCIRDTEGVRKVGDNYGDLKMNSLPVDVQLTIREFPVLRNVALIDGDTGGFL